MKRKLVRFDMSTKTEMRVPTREEVDLFVQYAKGMERNSSTRSWLRAPAGHGSSSRSAGTG